MKRNIFTPVLMLIVSFLFSAYGADTYIAGFEDGETNYSVNTEWADGYTWEIVDNSETGGINSSDKCFMATITNQNPDRWGLWVVIKLTDPILITSENRYVKIMAKRTPNDVNLGLCLKGAENSLFGLTKPAKAGTWGDVVFDLFNEDANISCENKEISTLMICLGTWDGTGPGVTMLDNMVLSDNSKPRGAQEIEPGTLVDFDDEDLTAKNFASFEVQSQNASYATVANPVVSIANPSGKCLSYNKPANTTWWHSLRCMVNGIIPVEYPNSNLHVMMYIPDATPTTVTAKSVTGKEARTTFYPTDGEGWYDCVLDVAELDYISEVSFRFNHISDEDWDNPAETYYVDDFALTDNPDPRESIITGMGGTASESVTVSVDRGMLSVASSGFTAVGVYSANGQLISQKTGTDLSFALPQGIYIIKVSGAAEKAFVKKVVIK